MPWSIVLALCVGMFSLSSVIKAEVAGDGTDGVLLTTDIPPLVTLGELSCDETRIDLDTPNHLGVLKGPGSGRAIGFKADSDFTISSVGILGELIKQSFDVVIYDSPDGHSAGNVLYTTSYSTGGTGLGWNDMPASFTFHGGTFYVLNWRPTGKGTWGELAYLNDSGLPFTVGPLAILEGLQGFNPNPGNAYHPHLRICTGKTPQPKPGVLQFSLASHSVNEGGTSVDITVTRTSGSDGAVSVDYTTSDGTANAGNDYTSTSDTLKWGNGDTVDKTFKVEIIDDGDVESNETVNLSLSNATGATIGSPSKAVLTIVDNDDEPPPSDCHATYSTTDRKVTIPLLDIPLLDPMTGEPTGETAVFKGALSILDGVEDFKIIPDSMAFIEMLEGDNKCHGTYSYADRTIHIPFVDVPSVMVIPPGIIIPGPIQVFEASMQQLPLANDVFHLKDYKYLYTIED
jgi:hypothetical protein